MEEKILKIVQNHVENNKPIDNSFIKNIIYTIIDSWKLDEYLNEIVFYNEYAIIINSNIYTFSPEKLPFLPPNIKKK